MTTSRVFAWLEERVPLAPVIEALRHKRVPQHRYSIWYYFGGITLFLFVVQVVTGGLLLLYYRPSAGEAYESVQFIMTRVAFGWLVRSIHAWSAYLMIAAAFGHLFSVLFLHGYRRPREVTWVSGAVLWLLVLAFGFTGYLLPWNELSFFTTSVGTDLAAIVPPTDAWVGLTDPAVCAACHDATSKSAETIETVRHGLDDLSAAIDRGDTVLVQAERAGMLVDDGRAALREAREHQVHARVLVHTFASKPFQGMASQGVRAARESQTAGEQALHELQVGRRGLLMATVVILGFLVTLGLKIRRVGMSA